MVKIEISSFLKQGENRGKTGENRGMRSEKCCLWFR